jgi:DNA-binding YbaB/EbfC family protein
MGSGFSKMKKQARLMQSQFSQMKEKMETTLVEGSAGNGLVTVTLNGAKELKNIVIKPECVSDIDGLQDLILGAYEDAARKISQESAGIQMPW